MKHAFKCRKNQNCSTAHVVDGKLILSFPGALTPVVWQMDLAQTKASALEIKDMKTGGAFALMLKTPKGETVEVASFAQKNEALNGLMAASGALQNAHGQIRLASAANGNEGPVDYAVRPRKAFSWKTFLLGCLMIFILLLLWSSFTAPVTDTASTPSATTVPNTGTAAAPDDTVNGVPLSADEFLRKR